MRAGASCAAAPQTLSPEAASALKHSLTLARRRGHAQVTPLHVAATLLSSRSSLLRRACLSSHPSAHHPPSHPLHCRALELCFNVALNRLPASPAPLLHAQPSLSNALVAALKRAQAHQRRGCIEQQQQQQQQPLIAVKVELEQLVLSILDDPSVSRVMREAGFSSTSVKNNLEDSTSVASVFQCYNTSGGGIFSTPNSPPTESRTIINPSSVWYSHFLPTQNHFLFSKPQQTSMTDDISVVMEVLVGKKKKNAVIVGDSLSMAETLVSDLMSKVEQGNVPDELKSAKLIKFQFSSVPLKFMNREEVDLNVADLKRKVDCSGGRVVIYIGDLKWAVEREGDEREGGFCSSITREYVKYNPIDHMILEIGKLVSWYNSSSVRVWLVATANYQTYMKCQMKQPPLDVQWALQAVSVPSGGLGLSLNAASGRDPRISFSENSSPVSDKKPSFLKEEAGGLTCCPECMSNYEKEVASAQLPYWLKSQSNGSLDKDDLDGLRRKYNKLCQSVHQGGQNAQNSSPLTANQSYVGRNNYHSSSFPCWPNKKNIFTDSETISFVKPSTLPRFRRQQSCHIEFSFSSKNQPNLDSLKGMEDKITLALGNSIYTDAQRRDKIADLCKDNVPWQSETIPLIVEALREKESVNEDTFILIQGNDVVGKRRLALAIAESMFGSSDLLLSMKMRQNGSHREKLERAFRDHEKIIVLVEDVDFAGPEFVKFLGDGFEAGKLETWGRKKSDASKAIFILTMDGDTKREDISSVVQMKLLVHESNHGLDRDRKRKGEWDFPEEVCSRELKRQLSANGLDLNMKAEEDECRLSPISSDLTLEIPLDQPAFVKKMRNRFVFNRDAEQEREAREMVRSRMRRGGVEVEEEVVEEVLKGAGVYLNRVFEEWVKESVERGIEQGVNSREKVRVRVCLGEKRGKGNCAEDGFKGTCLPKRIPLSFIG